MLVNCKDAEKCGNVRNMAKWAIPIDFVYHSVENIYNNYRPV